MSFAVLISLGVSFVVVAWPLFVDVQQGYSSLARDVQDLTSANVLELLLASSVAPVDTLAALSAGLARDVRVDSSFVSPSNERFQRLLFGHSQVARTGVVAGFPDGRITGYLGSMLGELSFVKAVWALDGTPSLLSFNTDFSGSLTALNSTVAAYDVRKESWYTVAICENSTIWKSKRRVVWALSELLPNSKCFGMTAARPIFYGSQLVAVLAMHFPLAAFSEAINATKIGISGQAFVLDHTGYVVGLSNPKDHNFTFDKLVHASTLQDPVFRDLLGYLMELSNGSYALIPQIQVDHVLLAGREYLLTTRLIASKDQHWTGIIIIPRSDYFAVPERAFNRLLGFSAVAAVLLCAVTIRCTALFHTRPLLRLAEGLETVAKTYTPSLPAGFGSLIDEVSVVETAYGRLVAALQKFHKYIPGPVVQQLMRNNGEAQPTVSTRECSFLFADIVGFVAISETTPAQLLHKHLSDYFEAMEDVLHDLNGITTDFLGDGLFVFWNAPIDQPDHAVLACEAALRQQARLKLLRQDWIRKELPALHVRIGINTGMCLVGSFGSSHHLKYTAMGDAVNTASRLEQLNKHYETSILIGEATFAKVQHVYLARPLDVVVAFGMATPVKVYELICRRDAATDEQILLAEQSTRLLRAFVAGDVPTAEDIASSILERTPDDVPTRLLRRRSIDNNASPRFATEK